MERRRKHWGWGYEDEQPSPEELRGAAEFLAGRLGFGCERARAAGAAVGGRRCPRRAWRPPAALAEICATDDYERALHAYGRSYTDVVRAFRGRFDHPPDVVAHPRDEAEVAGRARLGAVGGGGGDPVRRRHERGRRRRGGRLCEATRAS